MPFYRSVGEVPPKRHTQMRHADGGLYAEELIGEEGFASDASLLYHRFLPTSIVAARSIDRTDTPRTVENRPLTPRHLRTHQLDVGPADDPVLGRVPLLANDDCRISYAVSRTPSPLYRNATGDECVYIEAGTAVLESALGVLDVRAGDYVIIPTSVIHRLVPTGEAPLRTLVVEASGHIGPPQRYLSRRGQLLEHSPYCERDIRGPREPFLAEGSEVEVHVRHRRGWTVLTYEHHPFDVVGWDGCLYPWALSVHDFEPITGRVHQPPPAHQTFEGPNFVICSFVPRKVDYHPLAIPVPYNHHNVDSDEMMFYAGGDYAARKGSGIGIGSISLHPSGLTHGPQPGAVERSIGMEFFDELAVMVDTFRPLDLCEPALACEDPNYPWSWATGAASSPPSSPPSEPTG